MPRGRKNKSVLDLLEGRDIGEMLWSRLLVLRTWDMPVLASALVPSLFCLSESEIGRGLAVPGTATSLCSLQLCLSAPPLFRQSAVESTLPRKESWLAPFVRLSCPFFRLWAPQWGVRAFLRNLVSQNHEFLRHRVASRPPPHWCALVRGSNRPDSTGASVKRVGTSLCSPQTRSNRLP